jgi:hypothetical protein
MTPKEKAKELVDKFLLEVTGIDRYSYNIDSMNLFSAKQCALIAVNEVLDKDGYNNDYWKEVKQEIENL